MSIAVWTAARPPILASTSATRRDLLSGAGIAAEIVASGVDERAVEEAAEAERLKPAALALRLAAEKALAVSRRHPERWVIGADQLLDLDGEVLHKPADRAAAAAHLGRLSGRTHALHSAVALALDGALEDSFLETATLTMRPLASEAIARYLDAVGGRALQGAGAYQVEGLGIHLFARIAGSHSAILGLPLVPLLAILRDRGCLAF
jgi:septum formation protein